MSRAMRITAMALLLLSGIAIESARPREKAEQPIPAVAPGHRLAPRASRDAGKPSRATASVDSIVLGDWTFDDGMGGPDPQGWTPEDMTVNEEAFFHVEDFAGLGGGFLGYLTPLSGSKSLWCGTRTTPSGSQQWGQAPGYGNYWEQVFMSVPFAVTGDVSVDFLLRYDSEPGYDYTYVEYLSQSGSWNELANYTGPGGIAPLFVSLVVPADSLAGTAQLRFRFYSDFTYSDEDGFWNTDGAVILDSLTVSDDGGVVDFQDFETESVGALATADGDWTASPRSGYGNYAALFDGTAVLQEDSLVTNGTYFWGFFNGSTDDYACGGHPEQAAVPYEHGLELVNGSADTDFLWNSIVSPLIPITQDINGTPVIDPETIELQFDVYRDLPLDNLVFYNWRVRSLVGGTLGPWMSDNFVYYGEYKIWYRYGVDLLPFIDPGATHIQVSIEAVDMCEVWCNSFPPTGSGDCHSHAPLIDNVRVQASSGGDVLVVTNTNDSGPGSLRQAILDANTLIDQSVIQFNIPGGGPHTIAAVSQLPTMLYTTVVAGTTQPGYTNTPLIHIQKNFAGTGWGLRLNGDNSAIYAVEVTGFAEASDRGIQISSNNNRVEYCALSGNTTGIYVQSGTGNTFRSNAIDGNSGLGIDIDPIGVTANDALDADGGPNGTQNYPVIDNYEAASRLVSGYLLSSPNEVFTIDVYSSPVCDPSGNGEGAAHLASVQTMTDGGGLAGFLVTVPIVHYGDVLVATATDASGSTSEFSACFALPAAYVVTSTSYSQGAGGLRDAIDAANASPGLDYIEFNIPGPGPHNIEWSAGTISITDPVVIDGFTQPGASPNTNPMDQPCNAVLKIFVGNGMRFTGGNSVVRGLAIGTPSSGQHNVVFITVGGNKVQGCFLGLDVTGTTAIAHDYHGVVANSSNNLIGGPLPEDRNVIAGNGNGVYIVGPAGTGNVVQGNFIGTDITGTVALGNSNDGVFVTGANNTIGGISSETRNVISASGYGDVQISGEDADNNTVVGNLIGLDRTGTVLLGTVPTGVVNIAVQSGDNNAIGGATVGARNVCAGKSYGLWLFSTATNNTVFNNYFGTDVSGTTVFGFGVNGALLTGDNNIIGGTSPGQGNVFAGALNDGINFTLGTGNQLLGNSIHSNGALGIDIGFDGVTPNDALDADTGPNNTQNYPDIATVVLRPGSTLVAGTLSSAPSTTFWVEFFADDSCDPTGYGEGRLYLGGANVATDGGGTGPFDLTLLTNTPAGWFVSGTATDPGGNTSEFGACVQGINTGSGMSVSTSPVDETTGTTPVTVTFDDVTGAGNTTLTTSMFGPRLPGTFLTGDSVYYNIETTATYSGNIEVCIHYDEGSLLVPESSLRLAHWDTTLTPDDWVDVTSSLDVVADVICGIVTNLSPFALGIGSVTAVDGGAGEPARFALYPNVPNPFNPTTMIGYDVPAGGADVSIVIYDVAGRRVQTLVDEHRAPGHYQVPWDGRNARGVRVATGVYFYRMRAGNFVDTRKMVLLK